MRAATSGPSPAAVSSGWSWGDDPGEGGVGQAAGQAQGEHPPLPSTRSQEPAGSAGAGPAAAAPSSRGVWARGRSRSQKRETAGRSARKGAMST